MPANSDVIVANGNTMGSILSAISAAVPSPTSGQLVHVTNSQMGTLAYVWTGSSWQRSK